MARIRTVKPELFTHEELFDAEVATGLPLRLAYISLFTQCDREGRFKWRPRTLKAACLPFDDIEFTAILDALSDAGFVVRYEADGECYGCIPTWSEHQTINSRESASKAPAPQISDLDQEARARTCVHVRAQAERKGKERKGKEGVSCSPKGERANEYSIDFEEWWGKYPRKVGKRKAFAAYERARKRTTTDTLIDAVAEYAEATADREKRFIPHPQTWLNESRWQDDRSEWRLPADAQTRTGSQNEYATEPQAGRAF